MFILLRKSGQWASRSTERALNAMYVINYSTAFTANEHDGGLFCRFCYSKNFGVKGYRSGSNSVSQNASLERR
ncbi:hypothetical protein AHF37_07224 [Paragonimus kellicotti]|nr:hypothetical protein AHF37_07224 [Paragonimus kellicotti]